MVAPGEAGYQVHAVLVRCEGGLEPLAWRCLPAGGLPGLIRLGIAWESNPGH